MPGVPSEDRDWESTPATVAGDGIVWQGAACLRDAAIKFENHSIVCIVPMVYTDA